MDSLSWCSMHFASMCTVSAWPSPSVQAAYAPGLQSARRVCTCHAPRGPSTLCQACSARGTSTCSRGARPATRVKDLCGQNAGLHPSSSAHTNKHQGQWCVLGGMNASHCVLCPAPRMRLRGQARAWSPVFRRDAPVGRRP